MNKKRITLDGELFDQWLDWLNSGTDQGLDLLKADLVYLQRAANPQDPLRNAHPQT